MGLRPGSQSPECLVKSHIGSAYDNVKEVADNMDDVNLVADNMDVLKYGSVSFVQEEVPVAEGLTQGARWYKPSEPTMYIYYINEGETTGSWVEDNSVGDDASLDTIDVDDGRSLREYLESYDNYLSLKIFQSPTDGGLTEIQTRTVEAGEVYEVRKTSDGEYATIYSNAAGTTEIVQNGTDNKSGSDGVVEFYIADGDYYVEVDGVKSNFDAMSVMQSRQAIEAIYKAQGYNNIFFFEDGFTYTESNDVGIYKDGTAWTYADAGALPVDIDAGDIPSEPTYKPLSVKASNVSFDDGTNAQNFKSEVDSEILEIKNKPELFQSGGRSAIHYNTANSVHFHGDSMVMSGFRFRGKYIKEYARAFKSPSFINTASLLVDLGAEQVKTANTWYAVFAVANDGDLVCQFKLMPFIRLGEQLNSTTFEMTEAGENSFAASTVKTHSWGVGINGSDCLVVTSNERFRDAGRVTKVVSSNSTRVVLEDAVNLIKGDYILPAPKDFEFYRYCGSFYNDSAEVRNIADDGYYVGSRGVALLNLNSQGFEDGVVTKGRIAPLGNICPLASGIRIVSRSVFSTAQTGDYTEIYSTDGGDHAVDQDISYKISTGSEVISNRYVIPFGLYPTYHFSNAGDIAGLRSTGQHLPWGWYES